MRKWPVYMEMSYSELQKSWDTVFQRPLVLYVIPELWEFLTRLRYLPENNQWTCMEYLVVYVLCSKCGISSGTHETIICSFPKLFKAHFLLLIGFQSCLVNTVFQRLLPVTLVGEMRQWSQGGAPPGPMSRVRPVLEGSASLPRPLPSLGSSQDFLGLQFTGTDSLTLREQMVLE